MEQSNKSISKEINNCEDEYYDPINIGTVMIALLGCSCLFYFFPISKVKIHKST